MDLESSEKNIQVVTSNGYNSSLGTSRDHAASTPDGSSGDTAAIITAPNLSSTNNEGNVFVNSDHSSKCCHQMLTFWRKSQFCDINLVVLNTHGTPTACVAAHRVVIASAIPFFAIMLGVQMKEDDATHQELSLHGYESTAVKAIIEYAYTGKLSICGSNVQDILATAKRFTLPDVVSFCIEFMKREINPSNCISIRSFSLKQSLTDLHTLAVEYVIQNFSAVSQEDEFLSLSLEEVVELVKNDDILVNTEEDVYHAITRWIQHEESSRGIHADDLYDHVRFPITSERFLETVASKNKLLSSKKGAVYLKDGFEYHENPAAVIFSNPRKTHPRRSVQGIICLVGGASDPNTSLNSFTLCNPHEGGWIDGPQMNYKRSRLAVTIVQGELYAIGGYDQGYSLALCEKYSATENRWKEIAALNTARSGLAAVPVGKSLFAMGGYTGSVHLQSVEVYNPNTDEWSSGPPMMEARSELSSLYLDQYIYAIGGCNSKGDLRSVERFDLMNRKWELVSAMNSPRTGGAAALLGHEVMVCGGKGESQIINMAEVYDTETDLWEPVVSVMSNARVNFGLASLEDRIYVLGGSNLSGYINSVEYYDTRKLVWAEFNELPCDRFAPGAVTLTRKDLHC